MQKAPVGCYFIVASKQSLREKCPYSEFFWSVFSRIRTKKTPNSNTFHAVTGSCYNNLLTLKYPWSNLSTKVIFYQSNLCIIIQYIISLIFSMSSFFKVWKVISVPWQNFLRRYIWDKVFKNRPNKICGRQPSKTLKVYGLPKATTPLQIF